MRSNFHWYYKDTNEVALLPEIAFSYSTILCASSVIIGVFVPFGLAVFSYDDASKNVAVSALAVFLASFLVMSVSMAVGINYCETREVWEVERSFGERLSLLCKRRNDKTPERDNSLEKGNKTGNSGNHSFLRRLNVIKNFNLVDKFSRRLNTEEDHLLQAFNSDENTESHTESHVERERLRQNSSVYGAVDTTGILKGIYNPVF